jgi:MoaA/NifB/PqqE/SkfB family radical SAM enzyme
MSTPDGDEAPTERLARRKTLRYRVGHPVETLGKGYQALRFLAQRELYRRRAVKNDRVLERWVGDDDFPLPYIVMFETVSQCNGTCAFCPANRLVDTRGRNFMPLDVLEKAFDELGSLKYRSWLSFHINNEPLLDDRLPEIIRMARKKVPQALIQFWTNGTLLDWDKHRVLFDAGLNFLRINNYSLAGRWHRNVAAFLDAFKRSSHARDSMIEVKAYICNPEAVLTNKGGLAPNKMAGADFVPPAEKCHLPIWQFPVNYCGHVFLCCHDNFYSSVMGSLREHTIVDIWNSPRYREVRSALLRGDRSILPVCARCDVVTHSGALRVRTAPDGQRAFVQPGIETKVTLGRIYKGGSTSLEAAEVATKSSRT